MPILWENIIGSFGYWTKVCFSVLESPRNHYGTQSVLAHSVWWLWDVVLGIIEDHALLATLPSVSQLFPTWCLDYNITLLFLCTPYKVRTPAHCFWRLFEHKQLVCCLAWCWNLLVFSYLDEALNCFGCLGSFPQRMSQCPELGQYSACSLLCDLCDRHSCSRQHRSSSAAMH